MFAIFFGLALGIGLGFLYLLTKEQRIRRTLASSIVFGLVVGMLVELARRPLFTAIFAGVATIFLTEFVRWVLASLKKRP